jgi:alpha-galactosidase
LSRRSSRTRLSRRRLVANLIALPSTILLAAACAPAPAQPTLTSIPAVVAPPSPTARPTASAVPTAGLAPSPTPTAEVPTVPNGAPTAADAIAAAAWLKDRFAPASPDLPFSFVYGGQLSSKLVPSWTFTETPATLDANRTQHVYRYVDPASHLELRAEAIVYQDYPAVEWVLFFKNTGSAETPILEQVQALDLFLTANGTSTAAGTAADYTLHSARGSTAEATDFEPVDRHLAPGNKLSLEPGGGRSSDGVLPLFNVEQPDGNGVAIAVGWSGAWKASFARDQGNGLAVQAGMDLTHLKLLAGEEIRTPRMLLVFWVRNRLHGQNLLRRIILSHYTPTKNGQRIVGPIWASMTGDVGFNNTSEENELAGIKAIVQHKLPVEDFQMDAGWFVNGWPITGTWDPDPTRFPHGLKPIGDAAHQNGLGYILWFEPERVMPTTWLRTNHPEWLLTPSHLPGDLAYQQDWRLLNLGDPAALAWAQTTFSGFIRDYGVDVYRHDFNLHPLYYWSTNEAADRQGMTQIRYIEGFYAYWDYLLKAHPGLIIDNSASGGRRLDLEAISRSIALFRTDYFWNAGADQDMTYGLSFWLPISAQGVHQATDAYTFRSGMGTSVALAFDFSASVPWELLQPRLAEYRAIREYFYGDYYPLQHGIAGNSFWVAYQFDRPDLGEGMVLVFRQEGANRDTIVLKLPGLNGAATYDLTFVDDGTMKSLTGAALAQTGLECTLDTAPRSALVTYRRRS